MSFQITEKITLETEICCNCGVMFAMPAEMKARRLTDHKSFYCPAGHGQHYTGETAEQKLTRELEDAQRRMKIKDGIIAAERDQRLVTERRLRATKAAHTRTKNRIAAGVCPCCNRHFANLERHIAGQHPAYTTEE